MEDWNQFLFPYRQIVDELKIKLRGIRAEYTNSHRRSPIEFVTGRVKPVDSIKEKMSRRYIEESRLRQDMEDIAGLRIICPFIEDIYTVVNLLRQRSDLNILEERDYVHNEKASGYRSYHIAFEYTVQSTDGPTVLLAEIQVRTLAMNFWATVEHSINYKHQGNFPEILEKRLQHVAETTYKLDEEMSSIRKELAEYQNNKED
ncbi:GTP pyrophosphokinase family protein [Lactobacillus sp. Sy-1]|uniref:GTP pyrophosphokinase n=1 Tax=Lactobacillus sp. Sy-1 TaxID=2109645 RepID=UPI001C5966CF|nr:GTP pyrophosphokinase family protein [Lactobacillus sp. Sy-1]MBW1605401.1 GTP pyrophosphokinase family protein [Lactobacillus sp. Sy-1]